MSKESPLSSLIKKEYMMGHAGLVGLDRNYFKVHVMDLAEEYVAVVPNLTIDESKRLLESNRLQKAKIAELEEGKDRQIAELREALNTMAERMDKITK